MNKPNLQKLDPEIYEILIAEEKKQQEKLSIHILLLQLKLMN